MCSEYQVKTDPKTIVRALDEKVKNNSGQTSWDLTVKFSTKAPVIRATDDGYEIVERIFPVSPFPNSRLSGFTNQSDGGKEIEDGDEDRQIRRIYQVPRWKKSFAESPYLVPMTGFTEYAYWGEQAGSALQFKIQKDEVFFAAGIALKPFVPKTSKEDGFSILTHTATKQMLAFHQRLIVLLHAKHALTYLNEMSPEDRFQFLIENRYTGELNVKKIRNMAKGWEKRTPLQNTKLVKEQEYRQALSVEKVEG